MAILDAPSSYGQTADTQADINAALVGRRHPKNVRTLPHRRRLYFDQNCLSVVDWGVGTVSYYDHCSVLSTPDEQHYKVTTETAKQIVSDHHAARLDEGRAMDRLWHYDPAVRTSTGLSRRQAKRLNDDAMERIGDCYERARALVETLHESPAEWE